MRINWAALWRGVKVVLAVVIVGGVAWHFAKILGRPELRERHLVIDPLWIAAAMGLYAVGFACWGGFWWRLLRGMGQTLMLPLAARAYFVSQLGKYVPGKGLAVVMRADLARAAGARTSVAAITATYETLTTIAAGAIVAAVLFPLLEIKQEGLAWIAFGLPVVACLPIVPGVFNRVAALLSRPFLAKDAAPLPKLRFATLLGGLAQTSLGWFCLGASLLCLLRGLGMPPLSWSTCTACVALSYVAGFVTVIVPGGLGVREELLQLSLAAEFIALRPDEPEQKTLAIVAALVLRLVWTVTELALAGGSALLPRLLPRKTSA